MFPDVLRNALVCSQMFYRRLRCFQDIFKMFTEVLKMFSNVLKMFLDVLKVFCDLKMLSAVLKFCVPKIFSGCSQDLGPVGFTQWLKLNLC